MQRGILVGIIAAITVNGCVTVETAERQQALDQRIEAEWTANQAKIAEEEQTRIKTRADWLAEPGTQAYIQSLCSMAPGPDRDSMFAEASLKYSIIVSHDIKRAEAARRIGTPVETCPEPESTSSWLSGSGVFGSLQTGWDVGLSVDEVVRKIEAEVLAMEASRDQWLLSPEGQAYTRNLCALPSGVERDQAWNKAAVDEGIIPPERAINEARAREHGFVILDCGKRETSATYEPMPPMASFTWSDRHTRLAGFTWSSASRG